jgi:hypothetical protein
MSDCAAITEANIDTVPLAKRPPFRYFRSPRKSPGFLQFEDLFSHHYPLLDYDSASFFHASRIRSAL